MTWRGLILAVLAGCGGTMSHARGDVFYGRCLSASDVRAALTHSKSPASQAGKDKLGVGHLLEIYDDLTAARRAAATGAPPPRLTLQPCFPETVIVQIIFTGDEQPLQALASEALYATDPSPQDGLREAVTHFPTTNLLDLVALPNVQSVSEADPGELTFVAPSSWQRTRSVLETSQLSLRPRLSSCRTGA